MYKKDLSIALNAIGMQDRNNFIRFFSAVGVHRGGNSEEQASSSRGYM